MLHQRFQGLWRHPDFLKLWTGETISLFGSQITLLALPLAAVLTLHATPTQMGILGLVEFAPWLVTGLLAGALVDRLRRRPIMIGADLGRAALIGAIAFAGIAGVLRIEHLYITGFLVGVLSVFFEVAYTAYLPTLVPREGLVEGNSKLQATASAAEIGGPGLAGVLVQTLTAPIALIGDAVSFVVSALCLGWIRRPEPAPAPEQTQTSALLADIRKGLSIVLRHPLLRAFTCCSTTGNFFINIYLAVYMLYLTRVLGLQPVAIGAIYSVASVGGLLGAILAEPAARRVGLGRAITFSQTCHGLSALVIGLAAWQSLPVVVTVTVIIAAQVAWAMTQAIYMVNAVSLRQAMTPDHLQGRVMASMRVITWGIPPVGFLLGGLLGESLGLQGTLLVAGIGLLLSNGWLVLSPMPLLREPPDPQDIAAMVTTLPEPDRMPSS